MTGAANPNQLLKHGDYAHFPGSGPPGAMCRSCEHLKVKAKNVGRCAEVSRIRQIRMDEVHTIRDTTPACKYYVAKLKAFL